MTEATNQMRSNNAIDAYATSDLFANEFEKYMKISKRCTAGNLDKCFPSIIYTGKGEEIIVSSTLKTGVDFGKKTYTSPLVGLDLADGTMILLAFNPACPWQDPYSTMQNSSTQCLSMIFDINGFRGPNKLGKDIATLNANITLCDVKLADICLIGGDIEDYEPDGTFIWYNGSEYKNYWAGANKACADKGLRLPTRDELQKIDETGESDLKGVYWSSDNEFPAPLAFGWNFDAHAYSDGGLSNKLKVRCVK